MVDDRHVHGAEHAIRHRARPGNLQEMASLGHEFLAYSGSQSNIAFIFCDINQNIEFNFGSTIFHSRPMFPAMKPMIPRDAKSTALAGSADSDREDQSLHDETLTRLRDHIVEGNIPDGGRVPERELCGMLGISRTPLREALKVLASEGLVELLPNRGARVRQLSERDLAELFDVMGGLEGLAGRLACPRISDEQLAEIASLQAKMAEYF